MKKILMLLIISVLGITGCSEDEIYDVNHPNGECESNKGLPPMTTDDITLTYLTFDSEVMCEELAKRFEEKYTNIDVKIVYVSEGEIDDTLYHMVEAGYNLDCCMFADYEFAMSKGYLYDATKYWESDIENVNLLPMVGENKLGYFGTDSIMAMPVRYYPSVMFVEKNAVKKLGLDMPKMDWTWSDMMEFAKASTKIVDEEQYYGLYMRENLLGSSEYVVTDEDIARKDNIICGEEIWGPATGKVAVVSEDFWVYQDVLSTKYYKESLMLDYVPYKVPTMEQDNNIIESLYTINYGGIASSTKYPREAYELLKFMGWGSDGWKARLEIYNDKSIVNAANEPLFRQEMSVPLTLDEEICRDYKALFYDGTENDEYWDAYFNYLRESKLITIHEN